jgi:predicted DNA-binding transcriptional regulator YafY
MLAASRPPLARLAVIDQAVRAGDWPNARTLARRLEVHPRTIQRDLEFLRDRLGAPLEFDPVRNGYRYTQPDYRLPFVRLPEGELVALFLAGRVLSQYSGTPFEADLRRAYERLTALLPGELTVDLGGAAAALAVVPAALADQDAEVFRTLTRAAAGGERLEIDYDTAGRGARSVRRVDPYQVALVGGDWYLIAYCHRRRDVRMFAAQRVKAARPTGERFERPGDFSVEDYLGGSFRAVRGAGHYRVELRFAPGAAGRAAEKVWHRSQTAERTADGGLVLCFEVSDLREVKRWVLSWGAECEALGPPELRALIQHELRQMAARYRRPERPDRGRQPSP